VTSPPPVPTARQYRATHGRRSSAVSVAGIVARAVTPLSDSAPPSDPVTQPVSIWWRRRDSQLFTLGSALYLVTRFVGLTRFPIYFFCDEAVQATLADGLIHHGFRSADGVFLPPFLRNDQQFNLSLSVYLQIPAVALFGTTVLGTRSTSVVVGFLAVPALAVITRSFGLRSWWISPFVLASIPAWFLHSRTAFEVAEMVGFYACFLAAYLLYRYRSPRFAALVIACGGATFYAYANGQGLMLVTGVLLLASDLGYHRQQLRERRVMVPAAATLAIVAAPYLRELTLHRSATSSHLRLLNSYWYQPLSLSEKLSAFWRTYRRGLSPQYWFSPGHSPDLVRHVMKGMGHVWWPLLPFVIVGLVVCLRNWRSSKHRLVLIALVSAPFSAAMVEVVVTRALVTVIPIALLGCLGIDRVLRWIPEPDWRTASVSLIAVVLAGLTVGMTRNALANGPVWFDNYSLYGMQWGSSQVFGEIDARLRADDGLHVVVSSGWANNPNAFVPFFVGADRRDRVSFHDVDDYLVRYTAIDDDTLFVLSADDYADAKANDKFDLPDPEFVLPWPDGRPGFYFVRPRYVTDVEQRFEADRVERAKLFGDEVTIDGQVVTVRHPVLDIGTIRDAFDGDDQTVARGLNANPFVLELAFPTPRPVSTIRLVTQRMELGMTVVLLGPNGEELLRSETTHRGLPEHPTVTVALPAAGDGTPVVASVVRLELRDLASPDVSHVHVYELTLG